MFCPQCFRDKHDTVVVAGVPAGQSAGARGHNYARPTSPARAARQGRAGTCASSMHGQRPRSGCKQHHEPCRISRAGSTPISMHAMYTPPGPTPRATTFRTPNPQPCCCGACCSSPTAAPPPQLLPHSCSTTSPHSSQRNAHARPAAPAPSLPPARPSRPRPRARAACSAPAGVPGTVPLPPPGSSPPAHVQSMAREASGNAGSGVMTGRAFSCSCSAGRPTATPLSQALKSSPQVSKCMGAAGCQTKQTTQCCGFRRAAVREGRSPCIPPPPGPPWTTWCLPGLGLGPGGGACCSWALAWPTPHTRNIQHPRTHQAGSLLALSVLAIIAATQPPAPPHPPAGAASPAAPAAALAAPCCCLHKLSGMMKRSRQAAWLPPPGASRGRGRQGAPSVCMCG